MIAYFDCFSGISGDMVLGALIDAGVLPHKLQKELSRLNVKGYKLGIKKVKRAGLTATKVDVIQKTEGRRPRKTSPRGKHKAEVKKWKDVERTIKKSSLSEGIKQKGLLIFRKLFQEEAKVHGKKFDKVHLHELGALDCIIDILGTLIGLDMLGVREFYSSPLNLGSGTVGTEHGIIPVPAPATARLIRNVPVYSSGVSFELTTPTGAALISSLADDFGAMPKMQISRIGIGAGSKNFKKMPNVLRIFIGHPAPFGTGQGAADSITVIETNIDDMNPQIYEYVMEKLFKAGALDVFLTQIIMKKGRPGIKLTVLCNDKKKEDLINIILRETTSIGLRFYEAQRKTLHRRSKSVNTQVGRVRVKISSLGDDIVRVTPEYDDCKKIAKKFDIPLVDVYKEVAGSK